MVLPGKLYHTVPDGTLKKFENPALGRVKVVSRFVVHAWPGALVEKSAPLRKVPTHDVEDGPAQRTDDPQAVTLLRWCMVAAAGLVAS